MRLTKELKKEFCEEIKNILLQVCGEDIDDIASEFYDFAMNGEYKENYSLLYLTQAAISCLQQQISLISQLACQARKKYSPSNEAYFDKLIGDNQSKINSLAEAYAKKCPDFAQERDGRIDQIFEAVNIINQRLLSIEEQQDKILRQVSRMSAEKQAEKSPSAHRLMTFK